ncbi:MAG: ATP-binding protein [Polyangiales bacterium]
MTAHSPPSIAAVIAALVESTGDLVLVADWSTARFVDANDAALSRLGYTKAELQQLSGGDLSQFPREEHRRFSQELIELGETKISAVPIRCKDGSLLHMDLWARKFDHDGKTYNATLIRDPSAAPVSEHRFRVADTRLQQSEAFYRGVVQCTEDAVVVCDQESGECVEANPAACRLFQYTTAEFKAVPREALFADSAPRNVQDATGERGQARTCETWLLRKDGTSFVADMMQNSFENGGRRRLVMIIRDISDKERQRLQLERSQRLASVGEIAAGVAHEINNPAAFIQMNNEIISAQIDELAAFYASGQELIEAEVDPARRRALEALFAKAPDLAAIYTTASDNREGVERIRAVSRDLRLFARTEEHAVVEENLNAIVHGALKMLGNEVRHRATVTLDLADDLPPFPAWSGKFSQVATNLLLNAVQSITEGNAEANEIRVRTSREADELILSVEDTGGGIDEETMTHVFEPFFTTKPAEFGTGLGLPLCAKIVADHGGRIVVASTLGEGSCFRVHIPLDNGLRVTIPPPAPVTEDTAPGRILVIDDDPGMVRAYRRMLRRHDATVVSSGAEALALLEQREDFELVLCDLMMPEVDGLEVYASLMASAPHVAERLVFCTGGAFTTRARKFLEAIENEVVEKPLSHADVGRLLRNVRAD